MARFTKVQSNFNSGELNPHLKGRTDLDVYKDALDECFNMLPKKEGAVIRRPGSTFLSTITHLPNLYAQNNISDFSNVNIGSDIFAVSAAHNGRYVTGDPVTVSSSGTLPSPLIANTTYYVINSAGDIKLATSLADAIAGTAINLTTTGSGTLTMSLVTQDVADVHFVPYQTDSTTANIVAIVKLQDRIIIQVYYYSPTAFAPIFTIDTGVEWKTIYTPTQGSAVQAFGGSIGPYSMNIHKVQYSQSGDLLIMTFGDGTIPPIALRIGTTSFMYVYLYPSSKGFVGAGSGNSRVESPPTFILGTQPLGTLVNVLRVPFKDINSNQTTLTASAAVAPLGSANLTSSVAMFFAGMEYSYIKQTSGTNTYGWQIIGITSPTVASCVYLGNNTVNSITTAIKTWEISAWNDYYGHPRTITFHEQRLALSGNTDQPDTVWFSMTGNKYLFAQRRWAQDIVTPSDATGLNYYLDIGVAAPFVLSLASDRINEMNFLASSRDLYAGTAGAENVISSSNGLSATNFNIRPESTIGASYVMPLRLDNSVVFVARDGKGLRQINYSDKTQSIVPKDLTLQFGGIHENLMAFPKKSNITQLAYSGSRNTAFILIEDPAKTEYCIVSLVIDSGADVQGAAKHQLAGSGNLVKTMICLPNADTFQENLVMCVKRGSIFSVEEWHDDFDLSTITDYEGTNPDSATSLAFAPVYMDCAKVRTIASTTSINHATLAGSTVDVLADGIFYENIVLDGSGNGTIPLAATFFIVGLPYMSRIKLLPLNEDGNNNTDGIAQKKKVDTVWVKYRNSKHFTYGADENGNLYDAEIETALNTTALYSGIKRKNLNHSSDFEAKITIQTDKPYPLQILQVGYRGVTQEV